MIVSSTNQRLTNVRTRKDKLDRDSTEQNFGLATTTKHEAGERNNSLRNTFLPQEDATEPEVPGGFSRTAKIPATLDRHVSIVDVLERASKSAAQPLVGYKLSEHHAKLEFTRRRRRIEQLPKFAGSSRRGSTEWQLQGEQR